MSIPVSNIQPPQIVTTQPKANIAANKTPVAPNNANIAANNATPLPAKKIKPAEANVKNDNMKLAKAPIGVVNPPQDTYKYSLNNEVKEKQEATKDIRNFSSPLASSSLAGGTSKGGGFFKNLLIVGAVVAGTVFAVKKLKLSKAGSGIVSNVTDLKSHLDDVVNISKKGVLKPFNVKNTSVRLIDESTDNIKEVLTATRKLATEARNIEGKTPKVIIKLKETAGDSSKVIKEAFTKNDIESLSDEALSNIEYVNVEYLSSEKKSTEIIVNTIKSKFTDSSKPQSNGWDKVEKFFKDFLGD